MTSKRRAHWVVVDGDDEGQIGRCTRCGGVLRVKLPMHLKALAMYMEAFVEEHIHCKGEVSSAEWNEVDRA
jgi:hypothetical protein